MCPAGLLGHAACPRQAVPDFTTESLRQSQSTRVVRPDLLSAVVTRNIAKVHTGEESRHRTLSSVLAGGAKAGTQDRNPESDTRAEITECCFPMRSPCPFSMLSYGPGSLPRSGAATAIWALPRQSLMKQRLSHTCLQASLLEASSQLKGWRRGLKTGTGRLGRRSGM